ncbi:MAG: penicillin acylase family protein, partial [Acetobacteraceae bacterium]
MSKSRFVLHRLTLALSISLLVGACADDGSSDSSNPTEAPKSVTIKRDTYGTPHVYADTVRGVFHGFGYVVAEDRLYQMEIARRSVL